MIKILKILKMLLAMVVACAAASAAAQTYPSRPVQTPGGRSFARRRLPFGLSPQHTERRSSERPGSGPGER